MPQHTDTRVFCKPAVNGFMLCHIRPLTNNYFSLIKQFKVLISLVARDFLSLIQTLRVTTGTDYLSSMEGKKTKKKSAGKALHWAVLWSAVPGVWEWVIKVLLLMGGKNFAKVFWGWEL